MQHSIISSSQTDKSIETESAPEHELVHAQLVDVEQAEGLVPDDLHSHTHSALTQPASHTQPRIPSLTHSASHTQPPMWA